MRKVKFKVIELVDSRHQGSELEVDGIYEGEINAHGTEVYFTDKANDFWIFYVGDTCELV